MAQSLLALVLLSTAPDAGTAPPGLSCLPQWYAGTVVWKADAGWGLQLETGTFLPWASQQTPALDDEALEELPDLRDIYDPPYVAGPIVPLDVSDAGAIEDPGRARVEELFKATYGRSRDEVSQHLAKVRFFGLRYPFHERAADALARVAARLQPQVASHPKLRPFVRDIGGTWLWRTIKRSKHLSAHAFGIAIDLNVERSHYWRWTRRGEQLVWKNRIPQEIVDAFEAEGFIWGGRWVHFDTMHFEYRPELLSPACRAP